MRTGIAISLLTAALLAVPPSSAAQASIEITVKVPVNLTQLSPEIEKIKVGCNITTGALPSGSVTQAVELPVSGGQIVTTATLQFSLTNLDLTTSWGRNARLICDIRGYSAATSWHFFDVTSGTSPFRVTPMPGPLQSTITF